MHFVAKKVVKSGENKEENEHQWTISNTNGENHTGILTRERERPSSRKQKTFWKNRRLMCEHTRERPSNIRVARNQKEICCVAITVHHWKLRAPQAFPGRALTDTTEMLTTLKATNRTGAMCRQ